MPAIPLPPAAIALTLGALAIAAPSNAHAQSLDPEVTTAMHAYYRGEQRQGIVFMGVGAAGIAGGTALLFVENDRARAAAGPLLGFGLIELVAGIAFFARADGQIATRDALIRRDPAGFMRAERTRMLTVNSQLRMLEVIETVIALGGTATALVGAATRNEIAVGLGVGLALEGGVMLMLDRFEHLRAHRFLDTLEAHAPSLGVTPLTGGAAVTLAARF